MTADEARNAAVTYWLEKADSALAAANSEAQNRRLDFALNRAYYACFYAASAILLKEGRRFKKHAGVRSAVHTHLVKAGRIAPQLSRLFDRLFDERMRVDYLEFAQIDESSVRRIIAEAGQFVAAMQELVGPA